MYAHKDPFGWPEVLGTAIACVGVVLSFGDSVLNSKSSQGIYMLIILIGSLFNGTAKGQGSAHWDTLDCRISCLPPPPCLYCRAVYADLTTKHLSGPVTALAVIFNAACVMVVATVIKQCVSDHCVWFPDHVSTKALIGILYMGIFNAGIGAYLLFYVIKQIGVWYQCMGLRCENV